MTGMDILEFRDINQPPPVCKIIGNEENAPGGEILPPLALIGLNYTNTTVIFNHRSAWAKAKTKF